MTARARHSPPARVAISGIIFIRADIKAGRRGTLRSSRVGAGFGRAGDGVIDFFVLLVVHLVDAEVELGALLS